jgi:hypothetical protein
MLERVIQEDTRQRRTRTSPQEGIRHIRSDWRLEGNYNERRRLSRGFTLAAGRGATALCRRRLDLLWIMPRRSGRQACLLRAEVCR